MLGESRAQRIGARDDDAVFDTQLEECVADCADFGDEIRMRYRDLPVLVAALLLVGYLILNLNRTGTCLNHPARKKIGRLFVAESCVDVCNDRDHMGLELIDLVNDALHLNLVTAGACRI